MLAELFARMDCAPDYNSNPEDELIADFGSDHNDYGLGQNPH